MPDLLTFCRVDWKKLEIRFPTVLPPEHAFEYWKQWIEVEGRRRTGYAIWVRYFTGWSLATRTLTMSLDA